jgi:hypothetical protein
MQPFHAVRLVATLALANLEQAASMLDCTEVSHAVLDVLRNTRVGILGEVGSVRHHLIAVVRDEDTAHVALDVVRFFLDSKRSNGVQRGGRCRPPS